MKGEPAPSSYEYRGLRKNGSAIWLENRVSVVDWEGEPAILSVIVDISERHQVEAALRESEHMLAEAQRVGNMGHWRISVEPRGLQWSDEVFRIYGLDRETTVLTRELILPLHLPEEVNDYIQARDAAISGAAELSTEFRIRRPDGEIRKVTMIGQPELDDRGKVVALFGTVQDVTEQRQLQEQLVRSQKMEAIGQLTGGVAHDFNNLLAIVLGQSELMQYRQGKGDQRGAIDVIVRAAKRGAELTQRLLAFSRQQMLDPKIIDIDDLLPGIVALLRRTLGETIEVETGDTSELWHCEVDPGQLENALLNLAINARDAMPDGGKLTIEASNAVVEDSAVSAEPDVSPGSYVVLAVSDQGHGIASDHLEHVFEPFFTTKEVGSGSGLGLSMVYGFAQQSGGHATVTSEVGKGTTVKIYLPRAALQPDAREAGLPQAENLSGDETILVVEDDADVRYMTVALLETLGFSTIEAGDGAQALGLLESDASVDLLLTDIVLPGGMLGLELARRVTDLAPGTKVLFMSGYSEYLTLESGDQSHKLGADVPLLPKPFDRTKLARMVRAALDD
tara:strand:- start:1623 stop:3317 length:1695 start_codon:yes stop_codon:yes gene_type:complete